MTVFNKYFDFSRVVTICVIISFLLCSLPNYALTATLNLPEPGKLLLTSQSYVPAVLIGMKVNPNDPLKFNFILDTGDSHLDQKTVKSELQNLMNYFLGVLALPRKDLWVNLSPYESNRITSPALGRTSLGCDLLAQDYVLKQLAASLTYPETELGKKYWNDIQGRGGSRTAQITERPLTPSLAKRGSERSFNRVWITPDKASVYRHGNSVFITEAKLKVLMEEDYLARGHAEGGALRAVVMQKNNVGATPRGRPGQAQRPAPTLNPGIESFKTHILPIITQDVNTGKNFAKLRQIYSALILAMWYKQNLKDTILNQSYSDKSKVKGIDLADKTIKEKIYNQYVEAFQKGAYNYIKSERERPLTPSLAKRGNGSDALALVKRGPAQPGRVLGYGTKITRRQYFSGGFGVGRDFVVNDKDQRQDVPAPHGQVLDAQVKETPQPLLLSGADKATAPRGAFVLGAAAKVKEFDDPLAEAMAPLLKEATGVDKAARAAAFAELADTLFTVGHKRGDISFAVNAFQMARIVAGVSFNRGIIDELASLVKAHAADDQYGWRELFYIVADRYVDDLSLTALSAMDACYMQGTEGAYPYQDDWMALSKKVDISISHNPELLRECYERFANAERSVDHINVLNKAHPALWGPELITAIETGAHKALSAYRANGGGTINSDGEIVGLSLTRAGDEGGVLARKSIENILSGLRMLVKIIAQRPDLAVTISPNMVNIMRDLMADITRGALAAGDKSDKKGSFFAPSVYFEMFEALDYMTTLPQLAKPAFALVEEELAKGNKAMANALSTDLDVNDSIAKNILTQHGEKIYKVVMARLKEEVAQDKPVISETFIDFKENLAPQHKDSLNILAVLAKSNRAYAAKIVPQLLLLLVEDVKNGALSGQSRGGKSVGFQIGETLTNIAREYPILVAREMKKAFSDNTIARKTLMLLLRNLPESAIAQVFEVNIKLARFLKRRGGFEKILEDGFRQSINEIAYNMNRETTSHPAERRLNEDDKDNLFEYLFMTKHIYGAKQVFDNYFRNDPANYRVDIAQLNKILDKVSLAQVRKIIRLVKEDPKQSLEEITQALREQLHDQANAAFEERELLWILSNLLPAPDKLALVEPIAASLEARAAPEPLATILAQVDSTQKLARLVEIAQKNHLRVIDLLRLKMESVSAQAREDLFIDCLQNAASLLTLAGAQEIYDELNAQFNYQTDQSRVRIYRAVLLNQNSDNGFIQRVMDCLDSGSPLPGKNIPAGVKNFLIAYRALIAKEGTLFYKFWQEVRSLPDAALQKEAVKQLRKLYSNRAYSAAAVKVSQTVSDGLSRQSAEIALPLAQSQIPHIFCEPLLSLYFGNDSLSTFRQLMAAMEVSPAMQDSLATLRSQLYERLREYQADSKGHWGNKSSSSTIENILNALAKKHGPPSKENVEQFYNELMRYSAQFRTITNFRNAILDRYDQSGTSDQYRREHKPKLDLVNICLTKLKNSGVIDEGSLDEAMRLATTDQASAVLDTFGKVSIPNRAEVLKKLEDYMLTPRFKSWRDHMGRNIYDLILIYAQGISDVSRYADEGGPEAYEEIYQNLFDALMAEVEGRFTEWKRQSPDYMRFLSEVIDIEVGNLPQAEQEKFKALMAVAEGKDSYEKLQKIEGFEAIKRRVAQIRAGWEAAMKEDVESGVSAQFTDDFLILFNAGNYPNSTSCQSPAYGTKLSRGLMGYVANGTTKIVAAVDDAKHTVAGTRRIVKLRIITNEQGKKEAVIFVEEKGQHGSKDIRALYRLLDKLSEKTGLAVASPDFPEEGEVVEGEEAASDNYSVTVYKGRSSYEYSDRHGSELAEAFYVGLYHLTEAEAVTVRSVPLKVKEPSNKLKIEHFFDMNIAAFDTRSEADKIVEAEVDPSVHMVRVSKPASAQIVQLPGYFKRTAKVKYELQVPLLSGRSVDEAMDEYYGSFDSKHRRQYKKDVGIIDQAISDGKLEFVVDDGGRQSDLSDFLDLYKNLMGTKERGRIPLIDAVWKAGGPQEFMRTHTGIYLKKDGKVIGGVITSYAQGIYVIGYAATDRTAGFKNLQFYLMQRVLRRSIEEGRPTLSYGIDTNLYGHHLSTGLMRAKISAGFTPHVSGGDELIKFTNFEVFDDPIFFYNKGAGGELESTLIITPESVGHINEFEGVTPKLNIYIREGNKVIPYVVPAPEPVLKAPKKHTGGVDLRDDFTITVKGEKIPAGSRPASPLTVDIESLTPVILHITPVDDFAVFLAK